MNGEWTSLLGLANRAGKVVSGEGLVLKEVRSGKAKLVILSKDASSNTSKQIHDKCRHYNVPLVYAQTREQLGHSIGKEARVTAAVLETGFAKKLGTMLRD